MNKRKHSTTAPAMARVEQDSWMKSLRLQTVEVNTDRWTQRSEHLRLWRAARSATKAPRLH
jgi:hypothetical protein